MAKKITNMEIYCDACLDENLFSDANQEVGFIGEERIDFFQYEEQKDSLTEVNLESAPENMETTYVCTLCEGSGIAWDDNPFSEERKLCVQCKGTGLIKATRQVDPNEVV
jgi:hypothetical protein